MTNTTHDAPGSYWHELAADQQAGRFWKCRCGEANPGTYDTCHFCQGPNPTEPPTDDTGRIFTPTRDDMEDCYDGILVASLGEDGDAIALTGDKRQALEALDQYYRRVCGQPNLLDDAAADLRDAYYWLDCGHATFTRRADGGWTVTAADEGAHGAVPVTWFQTPGPVPQPYARRSDPNLPAHPWAGDHVGRAFTGTQVEAACPCPTAPCGLVYADRICDDCPHHAHTRSMRQSHNRANCPGGQQ